MEPTNAMPNTITEPRGCPTPGACSCPTTPFVPPELIRALELAEAALADIGDADREDGDDLAWAEARAAQDLPRVRAVLARWGRPAIEPVPVSERLPGPEDCDAEGECWWWHPDHKEDELSDGWMLLKPEWAEGRHDRDDSPIHTHWLPHHALPVPSHD